MEQYNRGKFHDIKKVGQNLFLLELFIFYSFSTFPVSSRVDGKKGHI